MSTSDELKSRTLTLSRTISAPVHLVWEAWTRADHIALWWGPKGMDVKVVEHDFRIGGKWKYTMEMPNGAEFISEGVYSEIIEHARIVTSANFRPMTEGVELQAQFEADGDKTNFTFSIVHPSEEYCRQQEKMGFYNGWGSALARLETYLSASQD